MSESTGDKHVDAVIEKHRARVAKGKAKYGCTLDTNPAGILERLTHSQEESMDRAVYDEWAKDAIVDLQRQLDDLRAQLADHHRALNQIVNALDIVQDRRMTPGELAERCVGAIEELKREHWRHAMPDGQVAADIRARANKDQQP